MKSLAKVTLLALCLALICAAAVSWHFIRARGTQRKPAEDAKAFRVRAEQGDAEAQYELAKLYYAGNGVTQDYAESLNWYRRAADKGSLKGQYAVGYLYHEGKGVPQDYNEAVSWYRRAADQGYARAQDAIGNAYYTGNGLRQDYGKAAEWYRKAAGQGYVPAQYGLCFMYSQGKGVPQDYNQANVWCRKAGDQGYAKAQSALGYIYSEGVGVPRDDAEAAHWYRKAAKQGDNDARCALDAMNIRLTVLDKVLLSTAVLGGILLLISSRARIRDPKQRKVTLAGLLLPLSAGLKIYGYSHLGILQSLSAVNVFFTCRGLLVGIGVAMLLSFLWVQGLKVLLGILGALFIALNVYGAMHYDLWHLAACQRAFFSTNASLLGAATTLAIFLLADRDEMKDIPKEIEP